MADPWAAFPVVGQGDPWAQFPMAQQDPQQQEAQARVQSESGTLQNIDNAVRSVARGIPVIGGGMDELSAGLNTGFGYLGDYPKELAYQRARDTQYDTEHPYLSGTGQLAGGIMGTVAGARALPAVAAPIAKVLPAPVVRALSAVAKPTTMPGKIGLGMVAGGGIGGVEGYTRGEGGNQSRMASALASAPIGAGIGMVAPPLAAGIGRLASGAVKAVAPSFQELKDATRAAYQKIHDMGIQYDPNEFAKMVKDATERFKGNFFPEQSGVANARLNDLQQMAKSTPEKFDPHTSSATLAKGERYTTPAIPTPPPTFEQLDSIRRALGAVLRQKIPAGAENSQENAAAAVLKDKLDTFMAKAPLIGKNADHPAANAAIKDARDLAQRVIKQDQLDIMIGKAQGYKSGVDSGLRLQFEGLLKKLEVGIQRQHNPRWTHVDGWTRDEFNAIKNVAQGTFKRNAAATLGRGGVDLGQKGNIAAWLPSSLGALVSGSHAFMTGGSHALTSALLGIGTVSGASALKVGARRATEKAANIAETLVRGGPMAQKALVAKQILADQKKRIAQALLTTQGARVGGTLAPAFVAGR